MRYWKVYEIGGKWARKLKIKDKIKTAILSKIKEPTKVIDDLLSKQDNSNINIHRVVKSVDNTEQRYEVIDKNMKEIVEQNSVKNTLKHLPDESIMKLLNKKRKILGKTGKTKNAIEAIKKNKNKLKAMEENIKALSDFDIQEILKNLNPEKDDENGDMLDEQKRKIVSMKIFSHIANEGAVWHLKELTEELREESRISVLEMCLETIHVFEDDKDEKIDSNVKIKMTLDLLNLTDQNYEEKIKKVEEYVDEKRTLTEREGREVKERLALDKIVKDVEDKEKLDLVAIVEPLEKYSQISLIEKCLEKIQTGERNHLVLQLLEIADVDYDKRFDLTHRYKEYGLLDPKNATKLNEQIASQKIIECATQEKELDLEALTKHLNWQSKIDIVNQCMIDICNYETENGKIDFQVKMDLISQLFDLSPGNFEMKINAVNQYVMLNFLKEEEATHIIENLKQKETQANESHGLEPVVEEGRI